MCTEEGEIAEVVRVHGWYAVSVYDGQPAFLYTVGLMQTCNHPEFIMFGLEANNARELFSALIREIRNGRSFAEPGVQTVTVGGEEHRVGFRKVHPTQHQLYMGYAMGYCRHIGRIGELEAVQAFWPDNAGKFPFELGCDLGVYQLQPRLDLELPPSETRESMRQWR